MSSEVIDADDLSAKARAAYERKKFKEALDLWKRVRQISPNDPSGFWGLGETLRELKMFSQADHWLSEGINQFPDDHGLRLSYGWAAAHRGDWAEAERRFFAAMPLWPGDHSTHFGLALARFELKKFVEAREALIPISDDDREHTRSLLARVEAELARLPSSSTDLPEQPVLDSVGKLKTSGQSAKALQLCEEGLHQYPDSPVLLVAHAELAQEAQDWPAALARWNKVKTVAPKLAQGYSGSAAALRSLGRTADADLMLTPALLLFGHDREVVRQAAWTSSEQDNWTEAARRFRMLQKVDPQSPEGFAGEMVALNNAGDPQSAEILGITSIKRFPSSLAIRAQHAQAAEAVEAWPTALGRWRSIRQEFRASAEPWSGLARSLIALDRIEHAEVAVGDALAEHPGEQKLLRLHAEIADRRKDKDAALPRWKALVETAGSSAAAALAYADALIRYGEVDEAEAFLQSARKHLAGNVEIDIALVRSSAHRRDWKTALNGLAEAKRRYGQHYLVTHAITELLWQARQDAGVRQREGDGEAIEIPQTLLEQEQGGEREAIRKLMLDFESLGGTCEFGMVQRQFGAEPLSLLRWSGNSAAMLTKAIQEEFRGIGDPAELVLEEINGEYTTRIPRYGMFSHTFSLASATPHDKFFAAQCKRMAYLREKLLGDIEAAEKIFTFGTGQLDDPSIEALFTAFRGLGARATLFCVRQIDERHPARSVVQKAEGLLVGAIERFSTTDIAIDDWVAVCQEAERLHGRR
jgi:tetratricopeptide (TPR) repeat protein